MSRDVQPPNTLMRNDAPLALDGVRVVDFTRVLAGPLATQTLADLGADVVKIEHPSDPDVFRLRPPQLGGTGAAFHALNRNKKSVALDLANDGHLATARELIGRADVVVENFTSRVMAKFGLDYESLKEDNPRLIYCSVSAYGRTGSKANAPGYDGIAAAEAGVSWMSATPETEHLMSMGGLPFVDITTAMNAASAILAALYAREKLGVGQHLDISLYDTAITDLTYVGYNALATGNEPARERYQATGGPSGFFQAADGMLAMIVANDRNFRALCTVLDRCDLASDPRFHDFNGRSKHLALINRVVGEVLKTRPRQYWLKRLQAERIPCAPVLSAGEALASEFTAERHLVGSVSHPTLGAIPVIGSPLRMSATPPAVPTPARGLGVDTRAVLQDWLNYDDAQLNAVDRSA